MQNSYTDVLEDWKVELISKRAKKKGFRGQDLLDVQQQIVMHLLEHPVDLDQLRTASEATILSVIVDSQLAMLRRKENRHRRRIENFLTQQGPNEVLPDPADQCDLSLDVAEAVAGLSEIEQTICRELGSGHSINEVATRLGLAWHTIRRHVKRIREHFEKVGLQFESPGCGAEADVAGAGPSKLLTATEAASLCRKSVRTWRAWDAGGLVPRPVRIGRSVFWRADELQAWIAAKCPARAEWDRLSA